MSTRGVVGNSPQNVSTSSLQATRSSSMESLESSMSTTESTNGIVDKMGPRLYCM